VNRDNGFADIRPQNAAVNQQNMSLGLPPTEAATAKLDVNGSTRVRQNLKVDGSDTVAGNAIVQQSLQVGGRGSFAANVRVAGTDSVNKLVANSAVVNGNSEVTGTLTVAETLTANTLAGSGTIPVGGIIMWSGTTAPDGWALCTGQTVNGKTTPDLQGKFIVGYQSSGDADYNSIGKTGGEKTHTLTINEMPSHSHTAVYTEGVRHNDSGNKYDPISGFQQGDVVGVGKSKENGNNGGQTNNTGGGAAHENRPPYYVLAFIMRVQ
jgi:microcystin-dependent protein